MKQHFIHIILLLFFALPGFSQVVVTDLSISEEKISGHILTGHYTYDTGNPNPEGSSQYRWYRAADANGTGTVQIIGETQTSYTIHSYDVNYYIGFEVIPFDDQGNMGIADTVYIGPITNNAPEVSITNVGGVWPINHTISANVFYSDTEGDPEGGSIYQWFSSPNKDGSYMPIPGAVNLNFTITQDQKDQFLYLQVIPFALSGASPGNNTYSDTIEVLNTAPNATVNDISGIRQINQTLSVTVNYTDLEEDPEGASEYRWYRSPVRTGAYSEIAGANSLNYTVTLSDKDHFLYFEVIPVAASGISPGIPAYSDTVQVVNTIPSATVTGIAGVFRINETLTANVNYSDLENDPQGASEYRWYRSSVRTGPYSQIPGANSVNYTLTLAEKDHFLYFEVIPVAASGASPGNPAYSDTLQVENTMPTAIVTGITGTPLINETLTANVNYSDLENDPQGASQYRWYRSTALTGPYSQIPGANSVNYTLTLSDRDQFLYFEVIPVASAGVSPGNPAHSDTLQVGNTVPTATITSITGIPRIGQTITVSVNYSDREDDPQGASQYRWYRGATRAGIYSQIPGANGLSYVISLADKDHYLYFEVVPFAASGANPGIAVRSDTLQYMNTAPVAQNTDINGTPRYNYTLTGSYTFFDADGDSEGSSTFRWMISSAKNGLYTPISGVTGLTYLVRLNDVDNYIYFEVTPRSVGGELQGLQYTSDTVFIGNEAPIASNVSISGTFQLGRILQGIYSFSDHEGNAEGTSAYQWYRANTATGLGKTIIPGANSKSYVIQPTDMDKYLSFEVTPVAASGTLVGNPVASAFSGPVSNAPPVAQNLLVTGQQLVCKTLTASYDYSDLEGDLEGATVYQWYRSSSPNGSKTAIAGAVDTFYTLTLEDQGKYIFFEVTPRAISGNIYGSPKMSNPVGSILNLLPTVTISGGKAICAGQTAPINFLFSGTPPFSLEYTDGLNNYSFTTSSYIHNVSVATAGNYKGIQLTDNLNCTVTNLPSNTTVTVNPLPSVEIIGLKEAYSVNSPAVQLTGNPTGGTFSGNGVLPSTNKFYPSIAGADTVAHPIIYTYTSPSNGCVNSDTVFVRVFDVDALIVGLRSSYMYCNFDKSFTLTGINKNDSIGTFTITGNIGLTDNGDNTATLSPSLLGVGQYTISYTYFDNVNQTITQNITVEHLEEARIIGISDGSYCRNASSLNITGNYTTGVFSGAGIVANTSGTYFAPSLARIGRNPIYFSYSTNYGCKTTDSVVLNILSLPRPDFEVQNVCWSGDSTKFLNHSQPLDSIAVWDWNFGDNFAPADQNKSVKFEPKHLYSSTGNRNVRLIAQKLDGCRDTIMKSIHLGDIPRANFYWNHECYTKGQSVQFVNKSSSIDNINKYKWTVYDTTVTPFTYNTPNILHVFPLVGNYNVKLMISTDYNCKDSVEKTITMLPVHILNDTVYNNNFESASNRWFPKANNQAEWHWGIPNGTLIKSAYSGINAYFTKFNGPRINSQLEILSPCFDFSNIKRPFIEMRINFDAANESEGAVLQYSNDDTLIWKNVGKFESGVSWFTSNTIAGSPGGQKTGWTGTSNGWISARHNLDSIKDIKNIKFRIVYAERAGAPVKDGFAFDDVYIGQRSKSVLFEHFTNTTSSGSNIANTELYKVLDAAGIDAISIQYHTSFPGTDTLNSYNQSDPGARVLFYGVGNVPACILDGGIEPKYIYNFSTQKPILADVNIRSLKDPYFDIHISSDHKVPHITGNVKVTALKDIENHKISLYIAIVEDIVVQSGQDQVVLRNVLKKLLPSAVGQTLKENWTKGSTVETSIDWEYTKVYNPKKVKIIAFIQDDQTREIYQVVSVITEPITSIRPVFADNSESIKLYPNPATYNVSIEFNNALPANCQMVIVDLNGKLLKTFLLLKNTSLFNFDVAGLASGMYIVQVRKANKIIASQKLLINR
jgi:hypothetical protein